MGSEMCIRDSPWTFHSNQHLPTPFPRELGLSLAHSLSRIFGQSIFEVQAEERRKAESPSCRLTRAPWSMFGVCAHNQRAPSMKMLPRVIHLLRGGSAQMAFLSFHFNRAGVSRPFLTFVFCCASKYYFSAHFAMALFSIYICVCIACTTF